MKPYYDHAGIQIFHGNALEVLKSMEAESIQCCVTSPPYWGLRDYGLLPMVWDGDENCKHEWVDNTYVRNTDKTADEKQKTNIGTIGRDEPVNNAFCQKCNAWRGSLGLEPTPELYVNHLVRIFSEVKRVLKNDGVLWLNLGDTYASQPASTGISYRRDRAAVVPCGRNLQGLKPKDLIGIPWRIAFALQQPYTEPMCIKSEIDRAWLAAMFDGEGCIGIRRFDSYRKEKKQVYQDGFVVYTVVTNNDVELLEKCIAITGKGKIALKQKAGTMDGRGIVSRRNSYGWRLDGNDAVDIIRAIYPYLIAKIKQACLAYSLDVINKNKRRVNGKVPSEDQDRKRFLFETIKKCNQREPVDIPNWVEEPKQKVEPGWYLRSDIIWHKPNPMPESVTDRPTKAHEYIFLLTKSGKYFYDAEAIKEKASENTHNRISYHKIERIKKERAAGANTSIGGGKTPKSVKPDGMIKQNHSFENAVCLPVDFRNKRSVWPIPTKPYKEAHFATFPPELPRICILAGSKIGDIIIDPFGGAMTTLMVAQQLNRKAVGIELNEDYIKIGMRRLQQNYLPFEL